MPDGMPPREYRISDAICEISCTKLLIDELIRGEGEYTALIPISVVLDRIADKLDRIDMDRRATVIEGRAA